MKIAFVLPRDKNDAIGGFKVVYEYANRLLKRGHEVTIIYNNTNTLERYQIPLSIKQFVIKTRTKWYPTWFNLDDRIIKDTYFGGVYKDNSFDAIFATSVGSVKPTLEAFPKGNVFYLIQDYENWHNSNEYVDTTYKMGMHNVVVSKWLKEIVFNVTGETPFLISNPIDLNIYKMNIPIEDRNPYSIGLLYHSNPNKGLQYSFDALQRLKMIYPQLHVEMFGNPKIQNELPSWIHYTRKATTQQTVEIYNSVAVFMCSSIDEGFGLTGMEAMACGATLASSEYTGVKEYAKNEYNALLSPVKDVDAMVKNVRCLIENCEMRKKLYKNAQTLLKDRTWDKCVELLESTIISTL